MITLYNVRQREEPCYLVVGPRSSGPDEPDTSLRRGADSAVILDR